MSKFCPRCKVSKLDKEFATSSYNRDGLAQMCKECANLRNKKYRETAAGRETKRRNNLKAKFNMTLEQYDKMYVTQAGRCAICHLHQFEACKAFSVDHDHETGEIRGLLCHNCNVGIGNLMDSTEILENAIQYLTKPVFTGLHVVKKAG